MTDGPDRPRARRLAHLACWWPYLCIAVLGAQLVATHAAQGGFTAAVGNTGDHARTGSLLTAAVSGGSTECDLGTAAYNPIVTNTASCSGNLTPSLATGLGTSTLTTTLTDKGGLPATAASLTAGACGPIQLADSATSTDPMLVRGSTLSYAQTGPLTGGTALGLSGTSAYAADVTSVSPPTTGFSEAVWFKTATAGSTTGGTLMGFANSPSNFSVTTSDRMIWLDNTGHVVFGVARNAVQTFEATTAAKYNDALWHLAVATFSSTTGMSLYVDAAAAATNTNKNAQATPVTGTSAGTASRPAPSGPPHPRTPSSPARSPTPPSSRPPDRNPGQFPLHLRHAVDVGQPRDGLVANALLDARRRRRHPIHRYGPQRQPRLVRLRRCHRRCDHHCHRLRLPDQRDSLPSTVRHESALDPGQQQQPLLRVSLPPPRKP